MFRKMGKKSKKRRRKKLSSSSSSSSEEDEKASKEQDATKNYRSARRRKAVNSQESCSGKQEKVTFPTIKDVSQSTRQIKKPVYRLEKTQAADQKLFTKEEKCRKTNIPSHAESCSSVAKNYISGKYSVSRHKTVQRGSSKPLKINSDGTVPRRIEETSKGSLDKKSHMRSPSIRPLTSLSVISSGQKEQRQSALTKKCTAKEPPRTGKNSDNIKTREPSNTSSISKDVLPQQKGELVKELCPRRPKIKFKVTKRLCTGAKPPSASLGSSKDSTSSSCLNAIKNVTVIPEKDKSVSHKTAESSPAQQQTCSIASTLPPDFKIPKKVQSRPADSTGGDNDAISANSNFKRGTELSNLEASVSNSKQAVQKAHSCLDVTSSLSSDRRDAVPSLLDQFSASSDPVTEPWFDEMQVVEELHLARSEKRLDVNVMHSYGELTGMDIDPPEDGAGNTHCKQPLHQNLILVLDTNILLSHLDYVKRIKARGLGEMGFPVVLIPWVVLQEMDSLKRGKGLSGSVAHLAIPAISYIYNSLKSREPHLWGQSMQQAAESANGLNAENNDDKVLQCCMQYQSLYPECALILCTNDKNLCIKALLSGVKAFSKNDLEAEVGRSRRGFRPLQSIKPSILTHISPQVLSPVLCTDYTSVQPHSQEDRGCSSQLLDSDNKQVSKKEDEEKTGWDLDRQVCDLEDCLHEVLSDVIEVEMKAAYEDLWLEVVYLKPPWTLKDVLQCLKKHWVAVFGLIVPRRKLQTILNLIDFFNSGKAVDCSAILAAIQEAKELVQAFGKSSSRVPSALSVMDNIFNKLQPPVNKCEGNHPTCDVVMNDDEDEDKQPTTTRVSHQEVWAMFERIWCNVLQVSMEVFKGLGFDPHTMQTSQPTGGPPPPQDALVCLHKLSSMVSQLLQAFSSVLSSAPGLEEVQTLLSIILSNKIVDVDSRFTAKDLRDCFSQQDYREKLRVGGNQLMELKRALDHCVGTITFTT